MILRVTFILSSLTTFGLPLINTPTIPALRKPCVPFILPGFCPAQLTYNTDGRVHLLVTVFAALCSLYGDPNVSVTGPRQ